MSRVLARGRLHPAVIAEGGNGSTLRQRESMARLNSCQSVAEEVVWMPLSSCPQSTLIRSRMASSDTMASRKARETCGGGGGGGGSGSSSGSSGGVGGGGPGVGRVGKRQSKGIDEREARRRAVRWQFDEESGQWRGMQLALTPLMPIASRPASAAAMLPFTSSAHDAAKA